MSSLKTPEKVFQNNACKKLFFLRLSNNSAKFGTDHHFGTFLNTTEVVTIAKTESFRPKTNNHALKSPKDFQICCQNIEEPGEKRAKKFCEILSMDCFNFAKN